jgi:hypothetical protein
MHIKESPPSSMTLLPQESHIDLVKPVVDAAKQRYCPTHVRHTFSTADTPLHHVIKA